MYAHEHLRRERRLHVLETEQGGNRRAVGQMHAHVFAFAFEIDDVADFHQRYLVVRLHRDILLVFGQRLRNGFRGVGRTLVVAQFVERVGLARRTTEIGEAERLEQVIHCVELEPFDGVFRVGGGEDHHRPFDQRTDELHAAQVGHVDIYEDQVGMLSGEKLLGFECVVARSGKLQIRNLPYVTFDLTQSQRLVVNGDTLKH